MEVDTDSSRSAFKVISEFQSNSNGRLLTVPTFEVKDDSVIGRRKFRVNARELESAIEVEPKGSKCQRLDSGVRYALTNTGRMTFSSNVADVSEMFRKMGNDGQGRRSGITGSDTDRDDTSRKLEKLKLADSSESAPTPRSHVATGAISKSARAGGQNGAQAVSSSNVSAKPVSGSTGRSTAMARMAAMGDEWPDEEELPGMQPASSLSKGDGISAGAGKQFSNSLQRQKKVASAKKK